METQLLLNKRTNFRALAWKRSWSMDFENGNAEQIMHTWECLPEKKWMDNLAFEFFLIMLQHHYERSGRLDKAALHLPDQLRGKKDQ